jgi:hypothetical protein
MQVSGPGLIVVSSADAKQLFPLIGTAFSTAGAPFGLLFSHGKSLEK